MTFFFYLFLGLLLFFGILTLCFIFYMIFQEQKDRKELIERIRKRKINVIINDRK